MSSTISHETTTIPYVSPDGGSTRYYADRFYLDAPTGLLEYQLAQKEKEKKCRSNDGSRLGSKRLSSNDSSPPYVEYCNGCGERVGETETEDDERILFDRAKFINSLDLSAAIIGTYSVGDFEYLSNEFPRLFPRKNQDDDGISKNKKRKRGKNDGNNNAKCREKDKDYHVPTLVLHGQRGFNLNRWARGRGRPTKESSHNLMRTYDDTKRMEQESQDSLPTDLLDDFVDESDDDNNNSDMDDYDDDDDESSLQMELKNTESAAGAIYSDDNSDMEDDDDDDVMGIRGGGDSQQHKIDSQDVLTYQTPPISKAEDADEVDKQKKPRAADKVVVIRPCFTYNSQKFKLPRTPKKSRRWSKRIRKEKNAKQQQAKSNADSIHTQIATACVIVGKKTKMANSEDGSSHKVVVKEDVEIIVIDSDSSQDVVDEKTKHALAKLSPAKKNSSKKTSFDHTVFAANTRWDNRVVKPVHSFGGNVFFTQILPAWRPPLLPKETKKERRAAAATAAWHGEEYQHNNEEEKEKFAKTVRGCHHPKFFLLFEKSGSLVVIISTSNLTSVTSTEGSWVQRFEPVVGNGEDDIGKSNVDVGMPSDFGAILTDFLEKQSEAAAMANTKAITYSARAIAGQNSSGAYVTVTKTLDDGNTDGIREDNEESVDCRQPEAKFPGSNADSDKVNAFLHGQEKTATFTHFTDFGHAQKWAKKYFSNKYVGSLLPDTFLRRFVSALRPKGLAGLVDQYQFDKAEVHLVSTVPGDHMGRLGAEKLRINYGPQRVASVLSRIHTENGKTSWLPPSLMTANDRLVIQPTSFGANWSSTYLETIAQSYLQPTNTTKPLELTDIVWPSLELFDEIERQRRIIWNKPPMEGESMVQRWANKSKENGMVFLSSENFSRLEQSVMSQMAQFEQTPNTMPYKSACIHFKSIGRLLRLDNNKFASTGSNSNAQSKEYLSWFMLTSACLSRGAQGQPTRMLPWAHLAGAMPPPKGPREEVEKMTYANFELGVLFCSRVTGDSLNDRLYVSDPNHVYGCHCGEGKGGGHNDTLSSRRKIKKCTTKVHLPVPYELRPRSYQEDSKSDMMTCTPYMNSITDGCTYNMMLTPLGQQMTMD